LNCREVARSEASTSDPSDLSNFAHLGREVSVDDSLSVDVELDGADNHPRAALGQLPGPTTHDRENYTTTHSEVSSDSSVSSS
jgi:hypothetical protein